jgi:hypothetical protein
LVPRRSMIDVQHRWAAPGNLQPGCAFGSLF